MSRTHDIIKEAGIDKRRLQTALDSEYWGKNVHAFEQVTAIAAVLATWPDDDDDS